MGLVVETGGDPRSVLNGTQGMHLALFVEAQYHARIGGGRVSGADGPREGARRVHALQGHQGADPVSLDRIGTGRANLAGDGEIEGYLE
jgi:hypothetical protein